MKVTSTRHQGNAQFDVVVIGSGPGGQRAAVQAAKSGKRVALIEKADQLGGGCVHWGTLPSKSLRESVYRWSLGSKGLLGKADQGSFVCDIAPADLPDMQRLMRRKERVIANESSIIEHQLIRNKVQVYGGLARFAGDHCVEVVHENGIISRLTADFVIIAVGARPVTPAFCQPDGFSVLDSNSVLHLKKTPKSMIVLGAGIIGCEYASIFQAAGTKVTLVDKRHEILSTVDREIVFHLVDRFIHLGMEIILEQDTLKIVGANPKDPSSLAQVTLQDGRVLEAETCLVALGRQGNTDQLQLEKVGLKADARGQLKVKHNYQTDVSWIYAVGDVIGFPALASTSMEQGRIAVCDAFQLTEELGKFDLYPYGIYTIPEISTLGKSEEQLIEEKVPFVTGRARYKEVARGMIVGDEWGMLKMMIHRDTRKILGIHIIGDNAADLIHIGQAVMQLGGDLQYFISSVFNYPTLAEAYKSAAYNAYNQLMGRASHE